MNKEHWLPVVYHESYYEVSNHGRIRRIERYGGAIVVRILKQRITSKGYCMVCLCDEHDHKTNKMVHRLVARAFIGPPPEGKVGIRHLNGNPRNNHVENLEWGDNPENKVVRGLGNG